MSPNALQKHYGGKMSIETSTRGMGDQLDQLETVQPQNEQPVDAASPAAGWYSDPNDESLLRWWNGAAWTDAVRADDGEGLAPSPGSGQPRSADHEIAGPVWFRRLGSGWSTVVLTGLAVPLSQFAALAMAGLHSAPGAGAWSSGAWLGALLGGLWMWKRGPAWDGFKRAIWIPVVLVSALSFVLVGLQNSYDVEVVDREARAATYSMQPTGKYDVVETSSRICEPGDDYLSCVNAHVANYNSVCVGQSLTWRGDSTCDSMSQFIDEIKAVYDDDCGYGCTTSGQVGEWGWPFVRVEAETAMQSNHDAQPRLTHTEHCSFDLGVIQVGTCTRARV